MTGDRGFAVNEESLRRNNALLDRARSAFDKQTDADKSMPFALP